MYRVGNEQLPERIPSLFGGEMALHYRLPHIWTQPVGSGAYGVYWSEEEALGRLYPEPSKEDLARYYGESYYTREGYQDYERQPSRLLDRIRGRLAWRARAQNKRDAAFYKAWLGPRSRRVLDVGCGGGGLLDEMKALGHEVTGVEPDEKAREGVRAKGHRILAGTGEAPPEALDGETFDLVCMVHALEHVFDPLLTLHNLVRLTKPGGLLYLEVPNTESVGAQNSGPAWYHSDAGRHLWYFTGASLARLAEKVGLRKKHTYYLEFAHQFSHERVEAEREVWDRLYGRGGPAPVPRPSPLGAWRSFLTSAVSPAPRAYEAVGVLLERPLEPGPEVRVAATRAWAPEPEAERDEAGETVDVDPPAPDTTPLPARRGDP